MKATCNISGMCSAIRNVENANNAVTEDTTVENMADSIVDAGGDDVAGDIIKAEM